jgi:hypothetical protein
LDPKLHVNGDNVEYMRLAESIRRGGPLWPPGRFPPGLPWLLVPVQALWGLALGPQKLLILGFYLAGAWVALRMAQETWGPWRGAALGAAAMTLVPVLEYAHYILSEIPFLTLSLLSLWLAERIRRQTEPSPRTVAAAMLAAVAAFYVRSVGFLLVLLLVLVLLRHPRRRRLLPAGAAGLALLLPWVLRTLGGQGGSAYLRQFFLVNPYYPEFGHVGPADLLQRVAANAKEYFLLEIPHLVWPVRFRSTYTEPYLLGQRLPLPVVVVSLALVGWGLLRGLRGARLWSWYTLAVLGVCLLWPPIWASSRFLVPVAPFLLWLFLDGAFALGRRVLGGKGRRAWEGGLVGVLLLLALVHAGRLVRQARAYPPAWQNYFEAAAWVRENTPPDVLVVDRKPTLFGFVSQRRCEAFPRVSEERLLEDFRRRGVDLVVLSRIPYRDIGRYLLPAVANHPENFQEIYRDRQPVEGEVYVFRFRP